MGVIPFLEFAGLKGEIPTIRTGNCKNVEALHACEGGGKLILSCQLPTD